MEGVFVRIAVARSPDQENNLLIYIYISIYINMFENKLQPIVDQITWPA